MPVSVQAMKLKSISNQKLDLNLLIHMEFNTDTLSLGTDIKGYLFLFLGVRLLFFICVKQCYPVGLPVNVSKCCFSKRHTLSESS